MLRTTAHEPGTPAAEIERREPDALERERALDAVTAAFERLDGQEARISTHVVTAGR